MYIEKLLIIGIAISNCLIYSYDDSAKDSATNDELVIKFCEEKYNIKIQKYEFEMTVDILNRTCTRKKIINKHIYTLHMIATRIISTECRKEYLSDILRQLEDELSRISTLYE